MANGRKTRSDRWDACLTDEQVWRAYDVFRRSKWVEFLAWAEAELAGVKVPSRNSMYEWARDLSERETAHRLRQAAEARAEVGALAETAALDATLAAAYKSMAATAALNGDKDTAVALTKMALGLAGQQVEAEKLRLQREKFESAEARLKAAEDTVSDAALSPEEQVAKIKALFGRK
jgi:hypothetical protein